MSTRARNVAAAKRALAGPKLQTGNPVAVAIQVLAEQGRFVGIIADAKTKLPAVCTRCSDSRSKRCLEYRER